MIVVGLTGSIAMGKTETAKIFRALGIPVFDSDAEVHRQYKKGGKGAKTLSPLFPEAVIQGVVDREILAKLVLADPEAMRKLETAIHPIVRAKQDAFLDQCAASGESIAVLDIPLLFETGHETEVDKVVVVSAPPDIQRQRVLQRPGMTPEKLDRILARQVSDAEKRAKADYVVDTSRGLEFAGGQVRDIVSSLRKNHPRSAP